MAREPAFPGDDPLASLENGDFGIGQRTDGTIDTFPAEELPARLAAQREEEAAISFAIEQSENGFPDEAEQTDISDLDELDAGATNA